MASAGKNHRGRLDAQMAAIAFMNAVVALVRHVCPYARDVNLAWLWARLHARTTRLGPRGRFQAFADQFAERLKQWCRLSMEAASSKYAQTSDANPSWEFDCRRTSSGTFDQCW